MRRLPLAIALLLLAACAAPPAPPPTAAPHTPPPPPPAAPAAERVTGTVRVMASGLNVRGEASVDADVLTQVRKGTVLSVLRREDGWVKVRLADEREGWVAARFVSGDPKAPRKGGCLPDSDYAFLQAPTPSFSEDGAHGLVVVEANVDTKGVVTSTKLISNGTGDEALAFLAAREIKSARFSPPIRNCAPSAFIFTYRRTF